MPYLGNPAQQRFSSPRAASVYSGDGSTVAFTLEEVVSTDEDILVSVDGVIQEPSVAYAVSSGTTLTFTGAPSSNAGNNIFVYYIARTFGSISMPDGQNVNAAVGTFSGTLGVTGTVTANGDMVLGGTTPTLTIGDAGAEDAKIVFDGNAQDYHIGLDDSADTLVIGKGSALGTTTAMSFDANGIITKPLQPAFLVRSAAQANLGNGGNDVAMSFATEVFDQNADFQAATGDGQGGDGSNLKGQFVAPVTGRYSLSTMGYILNIDTAASYVQIAIRTSNRTYHWLLDPNYAADLSYLPFGITILADMDANDTAHIAFNQNGGTSQTDINTDSNFSGYLVA